jgi:hypothetical protein
MKKIMPLLGALFIAVQVTSSHSASVSHRNDAVDPSNPSYKVCEFGASDPDDARNGSPCQNGWNAHYDCGATDSYVADDICKVHLPDGNVQPEPFDISSPFGGDTKGGGCGYRAILVTCHLPPNFIFNGTEGGSPSLVCGRGREQWASSFCATSKSQTFRVFQSGVSGGSGCGFTTAHALCYR